MFKLQPEKQADDWEIESLLDNAFGPGRFALSSYSLREGIKPVRQLSLVARDEFGTLCGTVRFWPVQVGKSMVLLLGPIAVHPTRQGEGLGAMLMSAGIKAAKKEGWKDILLVGDEPYYRQFGFVRAEGVDFPPPTNPERVLRLQLNGSDDQFKPTGRVTKWTRPIRD